MFDASVNSTFQQHGRAELLAGFKSDDASSIAYMTADCMYDTLSRVAGSSKSASSIPGYVHLYVQLKFVDLKILRLFIYY